MSYDDDQKDRDYVHRTGDWGLKYIITRGLVIFAIVAVLGCAVWAGTVILSSAKGEGDAVRSREAAPNRIYSQELFRELWEDIQAADRNITAKSAELAVRPNDTRVQTELSGLVSGCSDLVGRYNAEAESFTAEQFRDAELSERIDQTKPEFDCKG